MAELAHATALATGSAGVLLRGPSGSGKSDLALRALALPTGPWLAEPFRLIADDQVILERIGDRLAASAPERLAGLIEVRGVGIVEMPAGGVADVRLVVDLVAQGDVERLPDRLPCAEILGVPVPLARLFPFEASAPLKLALLMRVHFG